MMQNDKFSKNITIIISSLLFIPVVAVGIIKFTKFLKSEARIKRPIKTLSLDGISTPISLEELEKFESFSDCVVSGDVHYQNKDDKHIEVSYSGNRFAGNECCKKFFFCDKQLSICNFVFDNLSSKLKSKKIYKELIKTNGKPDKTHYDKKICCSQYVWHGRNGKIVYYKFRDSLIVIVFEIEK